MLMKLTTSINLMNNFLFLMGIFQNSEVSRKIALKIKNQFLQHFWNNSRTTFAFRDHANNG